MVSSNDIQRVLSKHIIVKEYQHIIICADRILAENLQEKNQIKDFMNAYFDYTVENVVDECAEEIFELLRQN